MPDQDEFAPITRKWQSTYDRVITQEYPEAIAQQARAVLKRMLQAAGGCPTLPRLVEILEHFARTIEVRDTPGWCICGEAETVFENALDDLSYNIGNRRIDAVAVRACRIDGIRLAEHVLDLQGESLGAVLATDVLVSVLRHSVLDQSSAHSVGVRCDEATARSIHDQVIQLLMPSLRKIGQKWLNDPSGQFKSHDLRLVPKRDTHSIMSDPAYRLDLD
ncbi:MAG TPA: death domain-containing protein [Ktedonobacterales bacterium]|nr:death domain-containing protein [Ktedonobacterales bacterium]